MGLRKIILAPILIIVFLEILLRLTGIFKTYSESNFGYFINPFDQVHESHYWLWTPDHDVTIQGAEFTYNYHTNSYGLVDDELDPGKAPNTFCFIGDSFTHGQGAPQDSSMPRLLEELMQVDYPNHYVLNGGIPSGDLFYYANLIEEILVPAGPRKFVIVMNTSDLYDYLWSGGRERFQKDGTTITRSSPYYMGLYRRLHTFRAFAHIILGFDHSYLTKRKTIQLKEKSIVAFTEELDRLKNFLDEKDASLMIIIHPVARNFSARNKNYLHDYSYLEQMRDSLHQRGHTVLDMKPLFKGIIKEENYLQYSWKLDKHFNSRGYELFAEKAYHEISNRYPEFLQFDPIDSVTITSQNRQ